MKKIADQIYEREYLTAKGGSRKKYYGIFTDWKGVRRTFPLGSNLKAAKTRLNIKLGENARQVDFDAEKKQKAEEQSRLRFSEWSQTYLEKLIDPEARSKKWQGYIV